MSIEILEQTRQLAVEFYEVFEAGKIARLTGENSVMDTIELDRTKLDGIFKEAFGDLVPDIPLATGKPETQMLRTIAMAYLAEMFICVQYCDTFDMGRYAVAVSFHAPKIRLEHFCYVPMFPGYEGPQKFLKTDMGPYTELRNILKEPIHILKKELIKAYRVRTAERWQPPSKLSGRRGG